MKTALINIILRIISKLYFKYCFKREDFAKQISTFYIPGKIDGTYFISQINDITNNDLKEYKPFKLIADIERDNENDKFTKYSEFDIEGLK